MSWCPADSAKRAIDRPGPSSITSIWSPERVRMLNVPLQHVALPFITSCGSTTPKPTENDARWSAPTHGAHSSTTIHVTSVHLAFLSASLPIRETTTPQPKIRRRATKRSSLENANVDGPPGNRLFRWASLSLSLRQIRSRSAAVVRTY